MACWTIIIIFAKILADHQEDYIAQRGDDWARVQIIKDCQKAILVTPQANHLSVALPDGLQSAIRTEFMKKLSESDLSDEEAAVEAKEEKQ
ncbi:hypothetical protein SCLCIDRAFT_34704 [Scleroderma citrinum Foug A]|uniref:Uncharacterized protein n=1 Tax=Scleroderma citrinum Foug A TaxID=1036808 RepID=A0A0C2ZAE7_9AGAM|nr:hypothetical protein SCLCIDRAFT_34704 [Scleroderma citrinum Foug A]